MTPDYDKKEQRTANTGFASGGVLLRQAQHNTCKLGALCPAMRASVLVDP